MSRRLSCIGPAALALLLVALPARAEGPADSSRLEQRSFRSEALGEERRYTVYLPAGYEPEGERRYPVVYLLHGLGGGDGDFFEHGRVARHLDALSEAGEIPPMIAVAPDGGDGYWTNHADTGKREGKRFGDYVARDLVAEIQRTLRVVPSREARALVGVSMGGYGALSLALGHPDRFGAAASLSGALFPSAPDHRRVYHRVWGSPPDEERFRATSPQHLLARVDESRLPALYLHCGDDDGLGFLPYTLRAHRTLAERSVAHELRITDGGHAWSVWAAQTPDWLRWIGERFRDLGR